MSYVSDSPSDRLAAVRAAINKCLTVQEYSLASRRTRYAELKQLREMEKELMEEVSQSAAGESMSSLGILGSD